MFRFSLKIVIASVVLSSLCSKLETYHNFTIISRSFVPPTRDEESETQRKAHAKRVRETRRSTQGVTLEEIKSAEQLVKKKNSTNAEVSTFSVNFYQLLTGFDVCCCLKVKRAFFCRKFDKRVL